MVADFYHRGGNGPTTGSDAVVVYMYAWVVDVIWYFHCPAR